MSNQLFLKAPWGRGRG